MRNQIQSTSNAGRLARGLALICLLGLALGCTEMKTLQDRVKAQDDELTRLRQENTEFQSAYYKIKETLDSETAQKATEADQLKRELEQARNLKTAQEKDLEDQLRKKNLEYEAFKGATDEQMTLSQSRAGKLEQDLKTASADRDAAQAKVNELTGQLQAEQKRTEELTQQVAAVRVDLKTAQDQSAGLNQEIAKRDQAAQQSSQQVADLTKKLEEATAAATQAQTQMADLQKKLDAASQSAKSGEQTQAELDKARKQIETLKAENASAAQQARTNPKNDAELTSASKTLAAAYQALPEAKGAEVRLDEKGLRVILPSDTLFQKGSIVLSDAAAGMLKPVVAQLGRLKGTAVQIEGHTDNQPVQDLPFADNWGLGYARADRVREYLMQQGGISGNRLTALSRADAEPLVSGDTPEARARNRRVEIVIKPAR